MACTTPISKGWITFVRPLGILLPGAEATMSIFPRHAQAKAKQKRAMMVAAIARPIADGGISTTSSAAGKNASSSLVRRALPAGNGMIVRLPDFMDAGL